MLYKKDSYLNKNIEYLISNEIVEYDMKSAGYNLIKKFKLVDNYKQNYLDTLGKKQCKIQIGLYQRADKQLKESLKEKFIEARQWFFENNNLQDEDILSIKKDAIVTTRRCLVTQWDNVEFSEKNIYTSYYYLNDYEFYYNKNIIDVKGISDEYLELHKEFMLEFLHEFFKMNEISTRKKVIELIKSFAYYYKSKELDVGYYRELNSQSLFRTNEKLFGRQVGLKQAGNKDHIDVGYNYMNYIVPLISMLV